MEFGPDWGLGGGCDLANEVFEGEFYSVAQRKSSDMTIEATCGPRCDGEPSHLMTWIAPPDGF